ncbi:MAG TPA: hypothetical protein VGL86_26335 [Polyangia bacterium]
MEDGLKHLCIHCGSADLAYSDDKQGFGAGKAIAGALAFGPLGLVAGAINKNKRHVHVRCNGCLKTFTADKMLKNEKRERNLAQMGVVGLVGSSAMVALLFAGLSYIVVDEGNFGVRFLLFGVLFLALFFFARKQARGNSTKDKGRDHPGNGS